MCRLVVYVHTLLMTVHILLPVCSLLLVTGCPLLFGMSAQTVVYIGGYKFGQLDKEVFIFVSK